MLRALTAGEPLRFNPRVHETSWEMLIHDRGQISLPPITVFSGDRLQEIIAGPGWFRFCVVRHPYDRFFSAWRDKIFLCEPGFEAYMPADGKKFNEFADFADRVTGSEDPVRCNPHWMAQVSLLLPDIITYTKIYNLKDVSDLQSDLEDHLRAVRVYDRIAPIQKINRSWSIPQDGFLTAAILTKLRKFYSEDFARFGFPEREAASVPETSSSGWVNEFTDAIFDRNRMIAAHSLCAQVAHKQVSQLGQESVKFFAEFSKIWCG